MHDWLIRRVALPLLARRSGSKVFDYLNILEQSQYDAPGVIQARQYLQLTRLLEHAYHTVPYYRQLFRRLGMHPSDVRSLDDLRHFPVLTKADLRTRRQELLSSAYPLEQCMRKKTSGSTGVPVMVYLDPHGLQWKTACTLRSDAWSGYRLGQPVAKVWGNPEYKQHGFKGWLRNRLIDRAIHLDTLGVSPAMLTAFVNQLLVHRPGLLFGHAHSLYLLACHVKKLGVQSIRPNGIISTSMVLHGWQRRVIEQVFQGPVTNRYGCEETSLIASECEAHHGLHVNSDSLFVEVAADRPDSASTGLGSLLVTDLTNRAMPLIRYKVGDVVVGSTRHCRCGRGLPLLERIEGREADYILTGDGRLISGISLTENFALHIQGTTQVQIIQERHEMLRLRLVVDEQFGFRSQQQIRALVEQTFGPSMRYQVELVEHIPQEPSGKYRFCISPIADAYLKDLSA